MAGIKLMISIDAPPEKGFPLVATAGGFALWWGGDVAESGGVVDLGFFNRTTVYRLQVARSVEPSAAAWLCLTGQDGDAPGAYFPA